MNKIYDKFLKEEVPSWKLTLDTIYPLYKPGDLICLHEEFDSIKSTVLINKYSIIEKLDGIILSYEVKIIKSSNFKINSTHKLSIFEVDNCRRKYIGNINNNEVLRLLYG